MTGTLIILDARPGRQRYGWLVSPQYCSTALHVGTWGSALEHFRPRPDVLLIGALTDRDRAAVGSVVRVSRTLGVRVVCDASTAGVSVLRAAVAAGATRWDGARATASAVFGRPHAR
ncbi:hypothetical protein [Curtobacterium sp. 1310]|uniref:hypothetical protein n=1 Tax=Curtobacterium sp. 1310 TaxID=2806570 RepID=UPI001AE9CA0F|nr:hypothetical protein [Curtobacterium sp. 1310]MBP1301174.1 hypothetical protein [Curtobacterium sp. 1310]